MMKMKLLIILTIEVLLVYDAVALASASDSEATSGRCSCNCTESEANCNSGINPQSQWSGDSKFDETKPLQWPWATSTVAVIGSAVTAKLGTAAGFTVAGITKGSLAATIQSKIGVGVLFSSLQSMGATGGMAMLGPAGLLGGAVAGVGYYYIVAREPTESS